MLVEYQFGWIVVLLAGYLFWERWPTRPGYDRTVPRWIPIVLVLLAVPCVLVAELYKQAVASTPSSSFALSIGCTLFILANALHLHGWPATRHFLLPLLFLFVAVPLPKIFWNPIVLGLQNLITTLNVETLNLVGIPAVQHANVIQLPKAVVGVDEACSGVRSLQSSVMAAVFIGDLMLRRAGAKLGLFAVGVALALVGNFLRSFYLCLTAHWHGSKALESAHDTTGWSILAFTAGGLALAAWMTSVFERRIRQRVRASGGDIRE